MAGPELSMLANSLNKLWVNTLNLARNYPSPARMDTVTEIKIKITAFCDVNLKMEAVCFSKTPCSFYHTTLHFLIRTRSLSLSTSPCKWQNIKWSTVTKMTKIYVMLDISVMLAFQPTVFKSLTTISMTTHHRRRHTVVLFYPEQSLVITG